MTVDAWAGLADQFVDGAYATVKGQVRTYVLHQHLLAHLPAPPATVLDIGGGAGNQSFPLARLGYEITLLDPSAAMLGKAEQRRAAEPVEVRDRIRLIEGPGEEAFQRTGGAQFDAVLCHGVLMYLPDPELLIRSIAACLAPGGIASIMALNADTLSVRPALERRWQDALAAFDARTEVGVLGVDTRADTVAGLSGLLATHGTATLSWYGVWLFSDLMELDASDEAHLSDIAAVELQASKRDPYRGMSRVFHLVGAKPSQE